MSNIPKYTPVTSREDKRIDDVCVFFEKGLARHQELGTFQVKSFTVQAGLMEDQKHHTDMLNVEIDVDADEFFYLDHTGRPWTTPTGNAAMHVAYQLSLAYLELHPEYRIVVWDFWVIPAPGRKKVALPWPSEIEMQMFP